MANLTLPKELQYIAETELNEIADRVEEDILHIRTWLSKQPHIKARTDDDTLLIFLRGCKFSLESTKKKLDAYYTIKTIIPQVFDKRCPFSYTSQYCLQRNLLACSHTPHGPLLIMIRINDVNPDELSLIDALKMGTMMCEVVLREYINSNVVGLSLWMDIKNIPLKYITQVTPTFLKTFITCLVTAYPIRIRSVHYINIPPIFFSTFQLLKLLLPKKLQGRVFTYKVGDDCNILEQFPSSVIPTEYGGEAGDFKELSTQLRSRIERYSKWFDEDNQYGCNEEKRPASSKLQVDYFGIDGSFRKLDID